MIPNYGFSPSNIYDFNRNYFTDAALLLCRKRFVILCSGSWHFRFAAYLAACCYVYALSHQHGRFHSKHTGHINGRTYRHRRHSHRQCYPALHTGSIPDTNPPAHPDTNLHTNCYGHTAAHPDTDTFGNANLDPNGNAITDRRANIYQYTDGNSDHGGNTHRDTNADLDTNTDGNPFTVIRAFWADMKNYGYVQNFTSLN